MRTIVNSTYVTLDGVIQNPQDWPSTGGFSEAGTQVQTQTLERCDAVLMGRHTYESFAPVWSNLSGDPFSDRINALPKYVVSTSLANPHWNNTTVIDQDPIDAIRELKQQDGGDIIQYGFGALTRALMATDLLDELRLWVHPFMVGTGGTSDLIFRSGTSGMFDLVDATTLDSGIIILTYRVAPVTDR